MTFLKYMLGVGLICSVLAVQGQDTIVSKCTRKTPEKGTKLSFFSKAILNSVNKEMATNPDSNFLAYEKRTTFRKKGAYRIIDTVLNTNDVPLRIFIPRQIKKGEELPVILFCHGGAFIFGSIETYNNLAGKICRKSNCIVVLPGYRLAPEHPFPAAPTDCFNTLNWIVDNISSLGGDKSKIGLIGDSAGGNLAMVTALMNRDKGNASIACQVLLYPNTLFTDTLLPSRNYFMGRYSKPYLLNEALLRKVKTQYLNGSSDTLPYVSPAMANLSTDLPPVFIITAQCDPLRDEGELLVTNLINAGVLVEHYQYKGMIHGFVSFYKFSRKGKKAIRTSIKFMHAQF